VREFWEQRYSEHGWAYGTEPNDFLRAQTRHFRPGARALVIGDGEGRNGVWLAQQGMAVLSVDYSRAGLKKARALAAAKGTRIETEHADLAAWDWPKCKFDLIVSIFVHFAPDVRPTIHRAMVDALVPGGVIILEGFNPRQVEHRSGGPRDPAMLYSADDLRGDFAAGQVELLEELETPLEEGKYHRGTGAVVRAIVRKPRS
jgi:SAM-dependent methyltransferase